MDLNFTAEEETFRTEVLDFLRASLPEDIATRMRAGKRLTRGEMAQWHHTLNQKGWLANHWPTEYGGPGGTPVEKFIFENECAIAGAPRVVPFILDKVTLGADALVGAEGKGAETLEHLTGYGLLALVSEAVGAMEVAKAHTLEYLRTREPFGMKIGTWQALQHRMADLLLDIEPARSAAIGAAAAVDAPGVERERSLSAAKHSIGQIGTRVAEEAIQLHGGIGMTWELPLAHYAKRLVMIDHQMGDEDHHLTRYIGFGKQV